jgi:hypothetical protein
MRAAGNRTKHFPPHLLIQRVNTVGGIAPSTLGTFVGQEARVPYTTEYFFYWEQ